MRITKDYKMHLLSAPLASKRQNKAYALLILPVLTCLWAGCGLTPKGNQAMQKPAPMVEVETVKPEDLTRSLQLTGEVIAVESARISSTVDGPISFLPFREGDRVQVGEKLIEIDRATLRAEVAAAEAALEVAKARLADLLAGTRPEEIDKASETLKQFKESAEFAAKDLERIEMLVKSGALPSEELEKAKVKQVSEQTKFTAARRQVDMLKAGLTITTIAVQRAVVKEAEAKVDLAAARLAECIIRAPLTGTVTRLWVKPGDMAAVKAPMLELTNFASLVIRCAVPEKHASELRIGMKATAGIDALPDRVVNAEIVRVFPELDQKLRTRTIELSTDITGELMPGMFARVNLVVQKYENVLALPVQAIRTNPAGKTIVFFAQEGQAMAKPVKPGIIVGNRQQIIEGISSGDKIIVAGNERLKDGAAIRMAGGNPGEKKNMPGQGGKEAAQ